MDDGSPTDAELAQKVDALSREAAGKLWIRALPVDRWDELTPQQKHWWSELLRGVGMGSVIFPNIVGFEAVNQEVDGWIQAFKNLVKVMGEAQVAEVPAVVRGASVATVELPFGEALKGVWCPFCGASALDVEWGPPSEPCAHLQFIHIDEVDECIYATDAVEAHEEACIERRLSVIGPSTLEIVTSFLNPSSGLVLQMVTGGMACGPSWNTTSFGFDAHPGAGEE